MFRTIPLSIIRSSFTVHTAMVYVLQLASRIRTSWSCSQAVSKPVWHIPLLCVQWKTPDDGQRNCPKHVELYSKNKFEKLMHLVGFIIRISHEARSPERQILTQHSTWHDAKIYCFLLFSNFVACNLLTLECLIPAYRWDRECVDICLMLISLLVEV